MSSQRSKPPRRRLRVEQIKDILVVSFVDRKILDEQNIQLIGEQLFSLVDEQGFEKLLLDFRNVEYKSSAAIGKLITLQKKLDRKHGRLIFYNLDPQIYEVYEITKFNRFFVIVNSLKDALALFDATAVLRVSCPVYNCRGCTNPLPPEALESSTLSLSCLACRTQFQVHATQTPESERTEAHVSLFQIPTYDQECISALVGFPSMIEVVGRLDLLAADALERAWRTVPPPRRILFDVRKAKELTEKGVEVLLKLCAAAQEDSESVVLVHRARRIPNTLLAAKAFVYSQKDNAVQALGEMPKEAREFVVVAVRKDTWYRR